MECQGDEVRRLHGHRQPRADILRYSALRVLRDDVDHDIVLMFIDITRAHPRCEMHRDVWVALPPEDPRSNDPELSERLLKSVHGLRDAGRNFELFAHSVMEGLDFDAGAGTQCNFQYCLRNPRVCVYGDDNFVSRGSRLDQEWLRTDLAKQMWTKWVRATHDKPDAVELLADVRLLADAVRAQRARED
ncbi:unnamed protein product [Prorocentrum cordatum]|uniref:Uncharacterized protein n=1 Tax=Prorocentrum cordatum TaxID=2364126 RepID=A0ABN9UX44_9DINO|nr:unnamed protein product [Polarella glacialis]